MSSPPTFTTDDIRRAYDAIRALGLSDEECNKILDSRMHTALCVISASKGEDLHTGGVMMLSELVRCVAISL